MIIRETQSRRVKQEMTKRYVGWVCYRYNHSWDYAQLPRTKFCKKHHLKAITQRDNPNCVPYYPGCKDKGDPWRFSFSFSLLKDIKVRQKKMNKLRQLLTPRTFLPVANMFKKHKQHGNPCSCWDYSVIVIAKSTFSHISLLCMTTMALIRNCISTRVRVIREGENLENKT